MVEKYKDPKNNQEEKRQLDTNLEESNKDSPEQENNIRFGKAVVLNAEAYKTIILYASRYANKSIPSEQWKEIYGLLIGYFDDEFLYVVRAVPMTSGHDPDVQFSETDYGDVEKLLEELDQEGKGYFIVGWFHSHPGLSLFFSYVDLVNQLGFQGKFSDAIGLVFDHSLLGKTKEEKIEGNILTKYDTGFEIYRLTDVNMDPNSAEYESNYHRVDYIVKGLNKFFFANVLAELSSLASAGKPLQSAYTEDYKLESKYQDIDDIEQSLDKPNEDDLVKIPLNKDIRFQGSNSLVSERYINPQEESADELIYQGNIEFTNKNYDNAIHLYKKGIDNFKKMGDTDRAMDLLRIISRKCTSNPNLFSYAKKFAEQLYEIANRYGELFYKGVANYILGYILLKENNPDVIEYALKKIEEAAVDFNRINDYAGAGMCFNKIGTTFEKIVKNIGSACLYYREAIENYNKAIKYSHPLRITPWSKPEILIERIIELRDLIDVLLPEVENFDIREKVIRDMKSIQYNF